MVTYSGCLDNEGSVKLNEILYVSGAPRLLDIYNGREIQEVRLSLKVSERLFFSYAETDDSYLIIADELRSYLEPRHNKMIGQNIKRSICCKGACFLFPKSILI